MKERIHSMLSKEKSGASLRVISNRMKEPETALMPFIEEMVSSGELLCVKGQRKVQGRDIFKFISTGSKQDVSEFERRCWAMSVNNQK